MSNYGVDVRRLLEELDVVFRESNGELRFRCPFHDDREPSAFMNMERGVWQCFGCGERGNVITFVEDLHSCSRDEAKLYLAEQHGAQFRRRQRDTRVLNRKRWLGQPVSGRKPGSDMANLYVRKRLIQKQADGQTPTELRRWIEKQFGVKKNYANKLLRQLKDEGRVIVEDGRCCGADRREMNQAEISWSSERSHEPSSTYPYVGRQITHPEPGILPARFPGYRGRYG